jgi:hypothetical protein
MYSRFVRHRLAQLGLAAAAAFVSVNIWTGAPLLALWIGSRTVPSSGLSMAAVFVVVAVLLLSVLLLVLALNRINARYNELIDAPPVERRTSPWLRSMRSEREDLAQQRHGHGASAVERVVVYSVMAAALTFNVWFFLFAGSPIG